MSARFPRRMAKTIFPIGEPRIAFGGFFLDPASGDLHNAAGPVPLTPKALALLAYLAARPGRLITKDELLDSLWPGVYVADGALKVCIREIRRALGDDARSPRFIETAHRRGYRFVAAISDPLPAPVEPLAEPATLTPAFAVHYARSGDVNIAYQVLGDGPIDLVFVMGWVSHLEYYWREPSFARFLSRLARFSRLILFDKRGTGLSDPVTQMPTLEQRMDDVRAVLDAVGSRRAALLGVSEGGPMCSLFAATYPNRTEALLMVGTYARRIRTPDYPWAPTDEERDVFCSEILQRWGGPVGIEERAPSRAADPAFRDWWSSYLRMGASPAAAVSLTRMNAQIDIRHILPTVRVPTLVLHRTGDRCLLVEEGRYVASLIPEARFVELPGHDHLPFVGDQDALLDEVERFLSGLLRTRLESQRMLATILCASVGGKPTSMDRVLEIVTAESTRHGGTSVQRSGDRVFAVFDGPARAIRCGCEIARVARRSQLPLSVGLHTGECDLRAGAAQGLVAEIGSRVASLGRPDEVLVSRTVVDLVAGSGLRFTDRGMHRLTGDAAEWRVFAVEPGDRSPDAAQSGTFRTTR
jgi:pimeloyl-ACP methyl ester carboxylesterase/DNA-binding winged helix-turn-helix (wHTH) protein